MSSDGYSVGELHRLTLRAVALPDSPSSGYPAEDAFPTSERSSRLPGGGCLEVTLGYGRGVADQSLAAAERVRTAEVIAALSLTYKTAGGFMWTDHLLKGVKNSEIGARISDHYPLWAEVGLTQ